MTPRAPVTDQVKRRMAFSAAYPHVHIEHVKDEWPSYYLAQWAADDGTVRRKISYDLKSLLDSLEEEFGGQLAPALGAVEEGVAVPPSPQGAPGLAAACSGAPP